MGNDTNLKRSNVKQNVKQKQNVKKTKTYKNQATFLFITTSITMIKENEYGIKLNILWQILIVVSLNALCFWNSVNNEFLWDDRAAVV